MSQPLFGLVPAGQPVIVTPSETPNPTSFLFAIPPSPSRPAAFHVVVFLLPGVVLPAGTAAAIYLVTPAGLGQTQPNSKFLGGIGPGKESAIFKIGGTSTTGTTGTTITAINAGNGQANVVLGISVEPADSVAARMTEGAAAASTTSNALVPLGGGAGAATTPTTLVLAQRIIKNAFNFLSGFSGKAGPDQVEVVPLRAFEEWWRKFENRVKTDPKFLERDE